MDELIIACKDMKGKRKRKLRKIHHMRYGAKHIFYIHSIEFEYINGTISLSVKDKF